MIEKLKYKNNSLIFFEIVLLILVFKLSSAQSNDFNIYVRKNMYSIENYFNENSVFKYYNVLGENYIDPEKKGGINDESICKGLKLLYPGEDASGYLVIDIENKVMKDFKNYSLNSSQYMEAVAKLKELLSLVRKLRPNLKISFYGLPFRVYFASQNAWNESNKLDQVLSLCDFITPSLYILYPDAEKGVEANRLI